MKYFVVAMATFFITGGIHSVPEIPLDESISYISGIGVPPQSILYPRMITSPYLDYSRRLHNGWSQIRKASLDNIPSWSKKEIPEKIHTVFYPFGGPDAMNALTFFPDAEKYILMGLESPGEIPNPVALSRKKDTIGLRLILSSMNEILGQNFFHTLKMEKKIAHHPYNGTTGIIAIMAKRLGYKIISVEFFPTHAVQKWKGMKMVVEDHNNKMKTIYYIQANIDDRYFSQNTVLVKFLQENPFDITMLKAASYLMFLPSFDDIRNFILAKSPIILQDASGIPYHFFQPQKFDVRLYGDYDKPIPLFANRCQPDLRASIKVKSQGGIPFFYGYISPHYKKTYLMVARAKNPSADTIVYDQSTSKGISTQCTGGRLIIIRH